MIEAEYTGPNNSLVCTSGVNDFVQVDYVNNARVGVLWIGPESQDVRYILETEVNPLTGIHVYTLEASFICELTYINSDIV